MTSPGATNVSAPAGATPLGGRYGRFLLPSIADWVFASILCWLFFGHGGAITLLGDGDTGWHIRTGEYILETLTFPREDLFSFSMEGKQWFAWEWLSDVILASIHSIAGLKGVVLLAGVVIAGTAALMLRYMLWLEANILVAIVMMLLASSASMVHWLARPHMFTWGLLLITVWMLEADRRANSRRIYWLVPLVIVWTNTHGGFLALPMAVGIYLAGVAGEQLLASFRKGWKGWFLPPAVRRYGLLLGLCALGTLASPYGWELHYHIYHYLGSDFILNNVQEFRSPSFRGQSMLVFEGTLFLGLLMCGRWLRRGELTSVLLLVAWAHASLLSVRHVPLFMIVAAPMLAREFTLMLNEAAASGNSWLKALRELAQDYGAKGKAVSESGPVLLSWLSVGAVVLIAAMLQLRSEEPSWKAEFPNVRFPVMAVDALEARLLERRVLSTDQWGDYLIYRHYPRMKVFIDGRSDFYDPAIRNEYLKLMGSKFDWDRIFRRHEFDAALLPLEWSLISVLKQHPDWHLVYDDGNALYFERISEGGQGSDAALERSSGQAGGVNQNRKVL